MQSYPIQSIKGESKELLQLSLFLTLKEILKKCILKKKNPKRLYRATEKIIKSYNFPPPPRIILNNKNEVKIKIPVNFILK